MLTQKAGQVLAEKDNHVSPCPRRQQGSKQKSNVRASLRHMPDVNDRNTISVRFLALNADAVAAGSRGAQNGLVIRSEDQSIGGSVREILSECGCLIDVAM